MCITLVEVASGPYLGNNCTPVVFMQSHSMQMEDMEIMLSSYSTAFKGIHTFENLHCRLIHHIWIDTTPEIASSTDRAVTITI